MQVAKPTSPMSVGTWIIAGCWPGIGLAAVSELPARWRSRLLGQVLCRLALRPRCPARRWPALASYTAVLLSQTSVPAWNRRAPLPAVRLHRLGRGQLRWDWGCCWPQWPRPARPAVRRHGAVAELLASRVMDSRLGLVGEAYEQAPRTGCGRRRSTSPPRPGSWAPCSAAATGSRPPPPGWP